MPKPQKSSDLGADLHGAARSGDLVAVQSICSSNPLAVNSRDKHSRTPLHLAAWSGHAQVVNYLCKNKADVGAAAMDDMGAIHFAAQKGHLEVVKTLLSSGASVKASTRKGMTALHYAIQGSHVELAKYLVKKGASLSAKTKAGKIPLDLTSSDQVRSFLIECEKQSDKGDLNGEKKAKEAHPKSPSQEKAEGSDNEVVVDRHEEEENEKDESIKRKGDEDDTNENSPMPKKAKVALNHLLTSDDGQEEEEIA
ncbi:Ankyrin repeat protein like [Actinidia chinensis var. chinensis]|uniref:Ankyrin repeat protein like n=1 Tax=Actinidia chinensis var. chinensis TaxID=1590841 RepID=A0A2R6PIL6_ACTCC|nr:Ankyrin repeat protein like [Actinidia chinensis var. chinensis]